jgi:RimJ/RimL family protein N-acetyltransferase
MIEPFTLEGPTVRLEPLRLEHVEALVAAASESRESYRFAHVPDGEAEMVAAVAGALGERDSGRRVPFATCRSGSATVVGTTSFSDLELWRWPKGSPHQREANPYAVEIGATWLSASAQGTGVNTEAKLLMLRHAFEEWRVHRVRFRTDERNRRSREAIARLGARLDGVLRGDKPGADGTVRNSAYFSILSDEWPAVLTRLEERVRRHAPALPTGVSWRAS